MRNRFYQAFTLVEMLIVMGILIILMVIGIAAGRFAINRANDVAHQNAAEQIYVALQAYYTDNREFPVSSGTGIYSAEELIGTSTVPGLLGEEGYLDVGSWGGGSDATFLYLVGGDAGKQAVLVCVSLRGTAEDHGERGDLGVWYCTGNGFNLDALDSPLAPATVTVISPTIDDEQNALLLEMNQAGANFGSSWVSNTWESTAP